MKYVCFVHSVTEMRVVKSERTKLVLAVETSGSGGGACLIENGQVLASARIDDGRVYGRELVPEIARIFESAKRVPSDMTLVVADIGPGSFTGLRVGLSAAAITAWSADVPVVAIVSLDSLAWGYADKIVSGGMENASLIPVVDAHRGEVFTASYVLSDKKTEGTVIAEWDGAALVRTKGFSVADPAALGKKIPGGSHIFGEAVKKYRGEIEKTMPDGCKFVSESGPSAENTGKLGILAASFGNYISADELRAFYMRRSTAEEKKLSSAG